METVSETQFNNEFYRRNQTFELLVLFHANQFPETHIGELGIPPPKDDPHLKLELPEWIMLDVAATRDQQSRVILGDFRPIASLLELARQDEPRQVLADYCQQQLDDKTIGPALTGSEGRLLTARDILPPTEVIEAMLHSLHSHKPQACPELKAYLIQTSAPLRQRHGAFLAASALYAKALASQ